METKQKCVSWPHNYIKSCINQINNNFYSYNSSSSLSSCLFSPHSSSYCCCSSASSPFSSSSAVCFCSRSKWLNDFWTFSLTGKPKFDGLWSQNYVCLSPHLIFVIKLLFSGMNKVNLICSHEGWRDTFMYISSLHDDVKSGEASSSTNIFMIDLKRNKQPKKNLKWLQTVLKKCVNIVYSKRLLLFWPH